MADELNLSKVAPNGYVKVVLDTSVYEAAIARIRACFTDYEHVIVNVSGGKDSTALMHLALEVAEDLGKLPLDVRFFDEELLDPESLAYMARVSQRDDVTMHWYCVPLLHTVSSDSRGSWVCWEPGVAWAREMPAGAITDIPGWGMDTINAGPLESVFGVGGASPYALRALYGDDLSSVCVLVGVRVQEAFNRRRGIFFSRGFITHNKSYVYAKPIYDWETDDVWRYILNNGFDVSAHYANLRKVGISLHHQRVAAWGNVSTRETGILSGLYPDFWERAIRRMPELDSHARYKDTSLYRRASGKPPGVTWQQYTFMLIDQLEGDTRAWAIKEVEGYLRRWGKVSQAPFPEDHAELNCWKRVASAIAKHDVTPRTKT